MWPPFRMVAEGFYIFQTAFLIVPVGLRDLLAERSEEGVRWKEVLRLWVYLSVVGYDVCAVLKEILSRFTHVLGVCGQVLLRIRHNLEALLEEKEEPHHD